jgi:hypothetical protein
MRAPAILAVLLAVLAAMPSPAIADEYQMLPLNSSAATLPGVGASYEAAAFKIDTTTGQLEYCRVTENWPSEAATTFPIHVCVASTPEKKSWYATDAHLSGKAAAVGFPPDKASFPHVWSVDEKGAVTFCSVEQESDTMGCQALNETAQSSDLPHLHKPHLLHLPSHLSRLPKM